MWWGVALSAALVVSGVVLVIVGSRALDGGSDRRLDSLFSGFIYGSLGGQVLDQEDHRTNFLNSSAFAVVVDAPVYSSFYLWNLTNAEELLLGQDSQALVEQVGPYTYEKRSVKRDVEFDKISGSEDFGSVSYRVETSYIFAPERSNGTEEDVVIAYNASYARRLAKLRARGYSERFLVAEFAHQHLRQYTQHLRGEFLADTKKRALRSLLPEIVADMRVESLHPVIKRQQSRVDSTSLSTVLVKMRAVAQTELIPTVLRDIYKNISDDYLAGLVAASYTQARTDALPRVLSNMYDRLQVEGVPSLLTRQIQYQQLVHVPRTLSSLSLHLERLAFPYVLREVFDRSCLETIPFLLRTIKTEIITRDIADNHATADNAQHALVDLWRLQGSSPTDFDAWIDNSPTGSPRTGFELLPPSLDLQLSIEVATLLLGLRPSNLRFSLVDYDAQTAASFPLDSPTVTPIGFAIWKQVIAMNESAISYVLSGVNDDVALTADYLTRAQLLFVRDYLVSWASSNITQRDRERYWRQPFTKRTVNCDVNDSNVDLDIEQTGVQLGFSLPSNSTVSATVAEQIWNVSNPFGFTHPMGFTRWFDVISTGGVASSIQVLVDGVSGLSSSHVTQVTTWISNMLADGFISRRALRHWSDGTCKSVLGVDLDSCLRYDLEPWIDGDQIGFEMNPSSDPTFKVSQVTRELLWGVAASSPSVSFLLPAHPSDPYSGFGLWMRAIQTSDFTAAIYNVHQSDFSESQARAVASWLNATATNSLNELAVKHWWTHSTRWPRQTLNVSSVSSVVTSGQGTCEPAYDEVEVSSTTAVTSNESPFSTYENVYSVTQRECALDPTTSTYSVNTTAFTLHAREYSDDTISTSLAIDEDEQTNGFELSLLATTSSDRLPITATLVLWNQETSLSFLNKTGFQMWFELDNTDGAGVGAIVASINTRMSSLCAVGIGGGGAHSSVFNSSLVDAACDPITGDHIRLISTWVKVQARSNWIRNALLDQWRRGSANQFDIEPYRDGIQSGLELSSGCVDSNCVLSSGQGTVYNIPRDALLLWNTTEAGSFLTNSGFSLWETIAIANTSGSTSAVTSAKQAVAVACSISQWEGWMDTVLDWLQTWKHNEHLVRDVLGHWLYAQCPTDPTVLQIAQTSSVVSTESTCPSGGRAEYEIQLSEPVSELQHVASRPTTYFDPDIADNAALVQPRKTVDTTETWISCTSLTPSTFTQQNVTVQSTKEYQACNLLRVLASSTDPTLPVDPIDDLFERNASTAPSISIPAAVRMWDDTSAFSFTNASSFRLKWFFALDDGDELQTRQDELNADVGGVASDLTAAQEYLARWESSDTMAGQMAATWLSNTPPFVDLDAGSDGDQTGLELVLSTDFIVKSGGALPTRSQAKMLWNSRNKYSFIRPGGESDNLTGLPVGFSAWKEIYEGIDWSSEQLVVQYPLRPVVERQLSMAYTLTVQQRNDLIDDMVAVTSLTKRQLRGIAGWVIGWANNQVLQDYVLHQWATGKTPRGDSTACLNLADHARRLYGLTDSAVGVWTPIDDFTVGSSMLAGMSKPQLRNVWNVAINGSITNPASRVIWCTVARGEDQLELQVAKYCSHILDDFGAISDAALQEFTSLVHPVLPQIPISQSANLTQLALAFLQLQLSLDDEQSLVIADWWRRRTSDSIFFRAHQLSEWSASSPSTAATQDPVRFGYDLARVLPWNQLVSRSATSNDLMPNTMVRASDNSTQTLSDCHLSLELLLSLWEADNEASFLNKRGSEAWCEFGRTGDETQIVSYLNGLSGDPTMSVITAQAIPAANVSCTLQAVGHWVKSWTNHPWLREFVELVWLEPLALSTYFQDQISSPSDMVAPFQLVLPLNSTAIGLTNSSWRTLARLVLDPDESVPVVDPFEGFSTWQALMTMCSSTDKVTGKCMAAVDNSAVIANSAQSAMRALTTKLGERFQVLRGAASTQPSIVTMIQDYVLPWLVGLLDSDILQQNVLEHLQQVEAVNTGTGDWLTFGSFADVAAIQFVNGSASSMNFSLTRGLEDLTDVGRVSERIARQDVAFISTLGQVRVVNDSFTPGLGELQAFCELNGRDISFAYDHETTCSLGSDYFVAVSDVEALWQVFADDTTAWQWPTTGDEAALAVGFPPTSSLPETARVALLIDAFLAQPFASTADCEFHMVHLGAAYADQLSAAQVNASCVELTVGEVYLSLPMLEAARFASKPRSFTTDMQAYLRYAATKFVFEPSVLSLSPTALDLSLPSSATATYPLGGVFARTTAVRALFGSSDSTRPTATALAIDSTAAREIASPSLMLRVPLRRDAALFAQRAYPVGGVLAVNGSSKLNVWGSTAALDVLKLTDGSQFSMAVLSGRTVSSSGVREYPPSKLQFYWDRTRRVVELEFLQNVTRFGSALMRYRVADWAAPATHANGLTATSGSVNLSYLADDVPLIFQPSSSTDNSVPVVDVDPPTGLVVHRRLVWQVAAQVDAVNGSIWHANLSRCSVPVVWVSEETGVSPNKAMVLSRVTRPGPFATEKLAWWGIIGGAAYIVIGLILAYVYIRRARVRRLQSVSPAHTEPSTNKHIIQHDDDQSGGKEDAGAEATDVGRDRLTSARARPHATTAVDELLERTESIVPA